MFEIFIYGLLLGYLLNPFISTVTAIISNAWNRTNACHGDCNQGRNCTCKENKNGIS